MKHIGIFNTSGDVQTALDNETFGNPYVAKVNGTLDYNTLQPAQPCYLGEWSEEGPEHYTFHINNTGDTAWINSVSIAQLFDMYPKGDGPYDVDVRLSLSNGESKCWVMEFHVDDQSDMPVHEFYEGDQEFWNSETFVNPDETGSYVMVDWDGADTFDFTVGDMSIPLEMDTINPECSEASE